MKKEPSSETQIGSCRIRNGWRILRYKGKWAAEVYVNGRCVWFDIGFTSSKKAQAAAQAKATSELV